MGNKKHTKYERLNVQHRKEAAVYDRARAWTDIAPLTAESVKDLNFSPKKTAVLDIAAGTGRVSEYFRDKAKFVIGYDLSPDMLGVAQAEKRIDFGVVGPGERLPFLDDSFDLVYCRSALHYMNVPKALEEWVRVTRDGGTIVIGDVSFEDEALNRWYHRMLVCLYSEFRLVRHQWIMKILKKLGQRKTDYAIHMVRGSVDDVARRKQIGPRRTARLKKMFETAPIHVRKGLHIEKAGSDYQFDFGWAITRCHVKK